MRAFFIMASAAAGVIAAYFGAPLIRGNDLAFNLLVTVFSVFSGFLVAVIAVIGDPMLLPTGSWRSAEAHREGIEARLLRHMWLFVLYLFTLAFLFVSALLRKADGLECVKVAVEYIYFGLGVTAFLLSLGLPRMLIAMQRARVDAEITRRRAREGIQD